MMNDKQIGLSTIYAHRTTKTPSVILFVLLFICCFMWTGVSFAQESVSPAQDQTASESIRVQQSIERYRIEQKIQQATAPLPKFKVTSPQPPPPDIEGKSREEIFKLNDVIFEPEPKGVKLDKLQAIAADYINKGKVSIYDLYEMVIRIDALFDEKHILGRAGLPVQDVENGTVKVEIIEGRESDRNITTVAPSYFGMGNTFFSRDNDKAKVLSHRAFGEYFVRHQFRFSDKSSSNIQKLENEMLRYNRTFNSWISAKLEPGDENGEVTLNLTRSLPQLLSGGYDKTEGTSSLSMRGDIPISPFGTSFEMSYYHGVPKTISGPFAALLINGDSKQYRPGLRQILVNEEKHRLDAALHYEDYDSRTYFDKALNYAEKHDAWTIGLEYSGQQHVSTAGFSFITGHAKTLAIPSPDYADSDFKLLKMSLMKVWSATEKSDTDVPKSNKKCFQLCTKLISAVWSPGKSTLILRGNAGVALSDLPQSQFFQIGGMSTVRGTPEALVSGDTGYLSVAEYRRLIWSAKGNKSYFSGSDVQVFAFFDHGGVFGRDNPDFLSSFGGGGKMRIGRNFYLTALYGIPVLTDKASEIYKDQLKPWSLKNLSFSFGVSF
jgi:hemolysin activation/secretion protein